MPKLLTKEILQAAADLLWDGEAGSGTTYMCHAIEGATSEWHGPHRRAFEALLQDHSVACNGDLLNPFGVRADALSSRKRQALRFDFLNLLAESL